MKEKKKSVLYRIIAMVMMMVLVLPMLMACSSDDEDTELTDEEKQFFKQLSYLEEYRSDADEKYYDPILMSINDDTQIEGVDYDSEAIRDELSDFYYDNINELENYSDDIYLIEDGDYEVYELTPKYVEEELDNSDDYDYDDDYDSLSNSNANSVSISTLGITLSGRAVDDLTPEQRTRNGYFIDEDGDVVYTVYENIKKASSVKTFYISLNKQTYREQLNSKEKKAYDVLMTMVQNGTKRVICNFELDFDGFMNAHNAVLYDHPELFYIRCFGISYCDISGKSCVYEATVVYDDNMLSIGIDKAIADVKKAAEPMMKEVRKKTSDIDKVKYIFDTLVTTVKYTDNVDTCKNSQNVYSSIVTKDTVCAGFSRAFQYYCYQLGIECSYLMSCYHAWNLLNLEGEYYYVDVTWGAPNKNNSAIDYKYFNYNDALEKKMAKRFDLDVLPNHSRNYLCKQLPKANGTKYTYDNWFGKKTDTTKSTTGDVVKKPTEKPTEKPTNNPDEDYAKKAPVLMNNINVAEKMELFEYEGVIYAEAKSFFDAVGAGGFKFYYHKVENNTLEIYSWFTDNQIYKMDIGASGMYSRDKETEEYTVWHEIGTTVIFVDDVLYVPLVELAKAMEVYGYNDLN